MRYRRPYVWECLSCGRLWVATPGRKVDEKFVDQVRGYNVSARLWGALTEYIRGDAVGHGGGCVPGEQSTWVTWCMTPPQAVAPWPELLAAHRLGGDVAAMELRRPVDARSYQGSRRPRRQRHAWTHWGNPQGNIFY